jgi:hypothetical protein
MSTQPASSPLAAEFVAVLTSPPCTSIDPAIEELFRTGLQADIIQFLERTEFFEDSDDPSESGDSPERSTEMSYMLTHDETTIIVLGFDPSQQPASKQVSACQDRPAGLPALANGVQPCNCECDGFEEAPWSPYREHFQVQKP